MLTVLLVASGLIQPVFAEETSKTPAKTESTIQTDNKVEDKVMTSETTAETEDTVKKDNKVEDTNSPPPKEEIIEKASKGDESRIEGTLTQAGTPLPNITFSIKSKANGSWYDTTTEKDGKYRFDLPVGEYLLSGIWLDSEKKWYALDKEMSVSKDHATIDIDLPGKVEVNASGVLTKDGQPLPKVTFSIHTTGKPEQWYDTTTNSDGHFGFILSDGDYKLEGIWVTADEKWYKLDKTFKVDNGKLEGLENLNIDLKTEQPPALNKVSGTLTQAGKPLPDILFSLHTKGAEEEEWYSATSDQDGYFELKLPKGDYEIDGIWVPAASKWHQLNQVFTVDDAMDLKIDLPSTPAPSEIKGNVTKGGTPLKNVSFSVHSMGTDPVWYDTKTDDDGHFTLKGLPDGDFQLDGIWSTEDSKWYLLQLKFTVEDGRLSGAEALSIDISTQLKSVKGHVTKGEAPVSNIWVSAHTTGGNVTWFDAKTDQTGAFDLTLPDGDYLIEGIWIESEAKWYPHNVEFTVLDGGLKGQSELLINLEKESPGNLAGTVFDGSKAAANAALYLENAETSEFFGVNADENGQFSLELKDGNYYVVSVTTNDIYYLYKQFTVENGKLLIDKVEAKSLDVNIPPASLVMEVHVNGQRIVTDGVKVINDEHGYGYWEYADQETGRITYRLPDGTFTVEGYYGEDGFFHYINQSITVEDGTTNPSPYIINIEDGAENFLTGSVRNESGVIPNTEFYIIEKNYEWHYQVQADAEGKYSINVPDGDYFISDVNSGGSLYGLVDIAFEVKGGKVNNQNQFDIVVSAKTLKGRLVNDGVPIVGEFYFKRDMNGAATEYSWSTDSQGSFSLRVPDGNYTITTAYGNDDWYEVNRTIEVANGTTNPNPFIIDTAKGNVTGSVNDDGGSVAEAEFFIDKVDSSSYYWVVSDSHGKFSVNIPDGDYFIHQVWGGNLPSNQYANEFFSVVKGKVIREGAPVNELSLKLPGETLKAKLVNHITPVAGEVFVSQKINEVTFDYYAVLDSNGEFSLRVPDGTYSVYRLFTTDDILDLNVDVEVKNGTTVPSPYVIDISNGDPILQGVVQDADGVISAGMITIERYTESGYDGWYNTEFTNGEFSMDLPDGTYKVVEIEENNGIVTLLNQDFSIEGSRLVVDGAAASKLTIKVPAITLKGTLWDGDTQVQSAELFVIKNNDDGSIYAYTNEQGVFSARLPNGSYTVEEAFLANNERIRLNQDFDIIAGKLTINGEETSSLEVHLPKVNVTGTLSDGQNVLADHHLTVFDSDGYYFSTETAGDGSFQLRLPDGDYKVHEAKYFSEMNDYVNYPLQTAFSIADGELQVKGTPAEELTITLPAVTLNAQIVDGGKPVAHASLRFIRELDGQFSYFYPMTDEDGSMSYRLPDGTYTLENITLSTGDSIDLTKEMNVKNGTTNPNPLIIDIH